MPNYVMCTVETCEYWRDHNHCGADQILVTAGMVPNPDDTHGYQAEAYPVTDTEEKDPTMCYTFEPKGDD
ncbi:MAG TPA: DUF1540 domain-containing protein [Armatimonadota bacterium]|jgi:anti-sigma factor ChrR (cupin superfamily)